MDHEELFVMGLLVGFIIGMGSCMYIGRHADCISSEIPSCEKFNERKSK